MFHFLDVDERKLKNVNKSGHKANKHVELEAMNAFEKWKKFCGCDIERFIAYWFENEEVIIKLVDVLSLFLKSPKRLGIYTFQPSVNSNSICDFNF